MNRESSCFPELPPHLLFQVQFGMWCWVGIEE